MGAVDLRVVEQGRRREQVAAVLLLTLEPGAEPHLPQVDRRPVTHQHVGAGAAGHGEGVAEVGCREALVVHGVLGDLLGLDLLGLLGVADAGVLAADAGFADDLARRGVEPVEGDAAVEIGRAPGSDIGHPPLDEDAAVDGPDRFDLVVRHGPSVGGGGAEAPGQHTVARAQGVDEPVGAAEEHEALVEGRRGVHPPAGLEGPAELAGVGAQSDHPMGIDGRHNDQPPGHDRGAQPAVELRGPGPREPRRHRRRGRAAPQRVVSVRRPVGWFRVPGSGCRSSAIGRSRLQSLSLGPGTRNLQLPFRRDGPEAVELGLHVAPTGV